MPTTPLLSSLSPDSINDSFIPFCRCGRFAVIKGKDGKKFFGCSNFWNKKPQESRCNYYRRQNLNIRRFPTQDDVDISEKNKNDEELDVPLNIVSDKQADDEWKEESYERCERTDLNEVTMKHSAAEVPLVESSSHAAEEREFIHDEEINSIFQLFLKQTISQRKSSFEELQKLKQECADVQQQLKLLHKCCDVAHEKINFLQNENNVLKEVNAYLKRLLKGVNKK